MTWITRETLSAVALALLLAGMAPALHAQSVGNPGDSESGNTGPGDGGQPVGGANSGGGELPKAPLPDHGTHGEPPIIHDAGDVEAGHGHATPSGNGGEGGGGRRGAVANRRRYLAHHTAGASADTGDVAARRLDAPAAPAPAPADSITTVVRLQGASGASLAGVLIIASDATGHVLAVAVTDDSGLALLQTKVSDAAVLLLDAAGGAFSGVAVPAGSATGIVLAH